MLWTAQSTTYGQRKVADILSSVLTEQLGVEVKMSKVHLSPFDNVDVDRLLVFDYFNDTLLYSSTVHADISILDLGLRTIVINKIILTDGEFNMRIQEGQTSDGLILLIDSLMANSTSSENPWEVGINSVQMQDFRFEMWNENVERTEMGLFDEQHIRVHDMQLLVDSMKFLSGGVSMVVSSLQGKEVFSGLEVKDIHTHFYLDQKELSLKRTELYVEDSRIEADVIFSYSSAKELSFFRDSVLMDISIHDSDVRTQDLLPFLPALKEIDGAYKLQGHAYGKLDDLLFRDIDFRFGKYSRLFNR